MVLTQIKQKWPSPSPPELLAVTVTTHFTDIVHRNVNNKEKISADATFFLHHQKQRNDFQKLDTVQGIYAHLYAYMLEHTLSILYISKNPYHLLRSSYVLSVLLHLFIIIDHSMK